MFIFNACRETKPLCPDPSYSEKNITAEPPDFSDMMVVFPNISGFQANRSFQHGSPFITQLCTALSDIPIDGMNIFDAMTNVCHNFKIKSNTDQRKQIPEITSTLTKSFIIGRSNYDKEMSEHYLKRRNVRFIGIPENIDMKRFILKLIVDTHIPINEDDIENIGKDGKHAIVTFKKRDTKSLLLSYKQNINRTDSGILVSEDLTKLRAKMAYQCKLLCRDGKIKRTWTTNGEVMVENNDGKEEAFVDNETLFEQMTHKNDNRIKIVRLGSD